MLASMAFNRRKWRPIRDALGIVHHATLLTKKEASYVFRLADTVRAVVGCGECGAAQGQDCVRKKDKQSMSNHSYRVRQARLLFEQHILPKLDRLHKTLCGDRFEGAAGHIVFNAADGLDVDCMTCLVAAAAV
jgi:hypothetical protein